MFIKTTCNKCGESFHIDLGNMSRDEAQAAFRKLDITSRQCPGGHVEFGGFRALWNLDDALRRAYDLGEALELTVPSDEDYVGRLLDEGRDIWDGGAGKVPGLGLRAIQDVPGLTHLGGGDFASGTHVFVRRDSPLGTRFYERLPRDPAMAGEGAAR